MLGALSCTGHSCMDHSSEESCALFWRCAHLAAAVTLDSDVFQGLSPHAVYNAMQAHDFLDDGVGVWHVLKHIICRARHMH